MTLNNDYIINTLANQEVKELHAWAANDRLARLAMAGRQPWWRRLAGLVRAGHPAPSANGAQAGREAVGSPRLGAHHVAR